MALDTSPTSAARDEPLAPAGSTVPRSGIPDGEPQGVAGETAGTPTGADTPQGPFSLATLLDLNDEDLAQPMSRVAPSEQRWEQLSLGVAPETGEAIPFGLRSGAASQLPSRDTDLIPGLDVPGAVEVPVYLAGRTLQELMQQMAAATEPIAGPPMEPPSEISAAPAANHDGAPTEPLRSARPSPVRPPAITVTAVGRPRHRMEAPAANFAKAESVPVLWPKRRKPVAVSVLPQECARCGAASDGDRCATCGHDTAVSARARRAGAVNDVIASFLESDSRLIRTIGALVLAPGELSSAYLGGHRRRYASPMLVTLATVVMFALVSGIGSLRPRPDRVLVLGTERLAERPAGLAEPAPVNLAVDSPPDLVRDVASALDYMPLLWLPLMAFGVVAVVAGVRTFQRREEHAELVFAAHFAAWFVLWWGLAVPLLLLFLKFGLEYAAASAGVTGVRLLEDGRVDGLSGTWNAVRSATLTSGFHGTLLALGLMPWAAAAYRRTFDTSWARATIAGVLIAAVPLLLLLPFG